MPPTRNNLGSPPPVMTWTRAAPVLVLCFIFDAIRFLFEWFVFFGPAIVALYCANKVGSVWLIGGLLAKGCVAIAGVGGFLAAAPLIAFGVVMAIAIGFLGWVTVGGILLISNGRIFKANALWFGLALLVSEVPFVDSIPALTITVWKMHSRQIKTEKAALAAWQKVNAEAQMQQQQNQQRAQVQMMQMQQAQFEEEEAANDELFDQEEAAEEEQREVAETQDNVIPFPSRKIRGPVITDEETPNKLSKAA